MTEHELLSATWLVLDSFQSRYWSPEWIPGHTPTVETQLNTAVEKLASATEAELKKALTRDAVSGEAVEDCYSLKELKTVCREYLNLANREADFSEKTLAKAGELMEMVLSNLNLTGVL